MLQRSAFVGGAAAMLLLTGCASNSIVGDQLSRSNAYFGTLGISGNLNDVTVDRQSRLEKLSIWGDANTVTVQDGATLGKIEIAGDDNTITIPAGLVVRISEVGDRNKLIRRSREGSVRVFRFDAEEGAGDQQ